MGATAVGVAASGTLLAGQKAQAQEVKKASELYKVTLLINGRKRAVLVEPRWSLLFVLNDELGLTAAKEGCGRGECGACTVLIDGKPRYACLTLALEAEGAQIETLESLMKGEELGPVQQAFLQEDGYQCGYCTPGQIMAAEGLCRQSQAVPSGDRPRDEQQPVPLRRLSPHLQCCQVGCTAEKVR